MGAMKRLQKEVKSLCRVLGFVLTSYRRSAAMRQIRVVISCVRNFVVNVGHDGQAGAGLELRQVCCNLLRKFIMLSNKISGKIKLS